MAGTGGETTRDATAPLPPLEADWPGLRVATMLASVATPGRGWALAHAVPSGRDGELPRLLETRDGGATWAERAFGAPLRRDPGWWVSLAVWLATAWLLLGAAQRRYVGSLLDDATLEAAWDELLARGPGALVDVWTGLGAILTLVLWPSLFALAARRLRAREWPPRSVEALALFEGEPALLFRDPRGGPRMARLIGGVWTVGPTAWTPTAPAP